MNQPAYPGPSLTDSPLANLVDEYGLTALELKMYMGLLKSGGSTAKELSKELVMNRVEVYRVLNRLLRRGLVSSTMSTPMIYQPARPKSAMQLLLQEFESKARRMKESSSEIIMELEALERATKQEHQPSDGGFRVLAGAVMWNTDRAMFERSRRSMQGIWSLRRMREAGLIQPFVDSVRGGVRAQIICQVTKRNIPEVKELMRVAAVRHFDGAERGLRFTIVDGRELSLGASTIEVSVDRSVAIWSDNQALVKTLATTFQALWRNSTDAEGVVSRLSM